MITEQELKKLLHPPTYDLYILQGMSLKSLEELVRDVVWDAYGGNKCKVPIFKKRLFYSAKLSFDTANNPHWFITRVCLDKGIRSRNILHYEGEDLDESVIKNTVIQDLLKITKKLIQPQKV